MSSAHLDLAASEEAFATGALYRRVPRDVVRVVGPQARDYLQGQCTQDLADLRAGDARFALLLSVQGKVEGFVRIRALAEDAFVLDTLAGQGEAVLARLKRFKIRIKAELGLERAEMLELRGPAVTVPADRPPDALVLPVFPRPALSGADVLGPLPVVPEGVPAGADAAFLVARIAAGLPEMGAELTEATIPFEAGIVAETTSFTKGCYTGQELIARLDARGANVPRRLRGLVIRLGADDPLPPVGSPLVVDEREVGRLTSIAYSARREAAVGLAYVQRSVEPPATGTLAGDEGPVAAQVLALPLPDA